MNVKFARFVMYACLLSIPLVGSAATSQSAKEALAKSATGPSFYKGDSAFRLVPGAIVVPAKALSKNGSSSRSTNAVTSAPDSQNDVARIGDYAIILPSASDAKKSQAQDLNAEKTFSETAPYGVAVSESSGLPVLVSPSITVYSSVATAKDIANKTGGKVTYSSELAEQTIIRYADVDSAIKALTTLPADGSLSANLDIIESFKQPM